MLSQFSTRAADDPAEHDPLSRALQVLNHRTGSVVPRDLPMPISKFKAQYSAVLKQADDGGVALISQGSKRYVIVSEQQMVALSSSERVPRTVADVCMALPRPRQAVELSSDQMVGSRDDIEVPTRRS